MSIKGLFSVKLGIRKVLLTINVVLLAVILIGGAMIIPQLLDSNLSSTISPIVLVMMLVAVMVHILTHFYGQSITKPIKNAATIPKIISGSGISTNITHYNINS